MYYTENFGERRERERKGGKLLLVGVSGDGGQNLGLQCKNRI